MRILIVDDHEGFRRQARALLESEGYVVAGEASDAPEALAVLDAVLPEVVLLDVQLPNGNGFDLAEDMIARHPEIRIVLTSGNDAALYRRRLEWTLARGFVSKALLSHQTLSEVLGDDLAVRPEPA